ncbi:GtrA family protein [Gryllotalpicola reticulitermitis]|uniref:GtrA family protein n=1 Tax=Gryllotalpicola reticulitermitis TaxID=1184153 RepID=A0ABV8Q5C0_9MICO
MPHKPSKLMQLVGDAVRFGMVGGVCYVLDVALFNVLRVSPAGFFSEPLVAKTLGVALATVAAWLGTRYWTFRRNLRADAGREFVEFVLVAGAGYAANLIILFVSHYVLGFRSLLADNISGNLIGAAVGAVVRFLLYRAWVYHPDRARAVGEGTAAEGAGGETSDSADAAGDRTANDGASSYPESDATRGTSPRGAQR